MKKEIYIIKNKINKKVYIGQSVNSKIRFRNHIANGKLMNNTSLIDKAINKYGVENFWFEILEVTEQYNEREQYWINYYNSITPNGYNILAGGGDFGGFGVNNFHAIIKDQKILDELVNEIKYSNIKLVDLGKKYNISLSTVSAINRGTAYHNDNNSYPLRRRHSDDIKDTTNDLIAKELLNTNKTYREIAKEYNVTTYYVGEINSGQRLNKYSNNFPLRKVEKDPIFEAIYEQLLNTNKSLRQIARDLNISYSKVQTFNSGKYHHDSSINYPIRKPK